MSKHVLFFSEISSEVISYENKIPARKNNYVPGILTVIFHIFSFQQKQRDRQLERKKCLARDLSDLIVYAVAVPFDIDSK